MVPREEWAAASAAALTTIKATGVASSKTVPQTKVTDRTHAREIPLVVCPLGSKVSFGWKGRMHDVWQLPSEDAYNTCKFEGGVDGAKKVSDASTSASFEFLCEKVGTYYFSCSVDEACSIGNQKVRIYVSDPSKTVKLRAKGGMSLEEFNRKYTLLFAGYALNKQALSVNNADQAIVEAQSLLANSPESCADWIPESWNSHQSCQAFIYTDLGFLSRVRPDPDYAASEKYYKKALEISPGMCGATAYMAELRVAQNKKAEADLQYLETCTACGQHNMDFIDLFDAYSARNWKQPACPAPIVSTPKSSTYCKGAFPADWAARTRKSLAQCKASCAASKSCAAIVVGTFAGVTDNCVLCTTSVWGTADWTTTHFIQKPAALVTSTGTVAVKMSKDHAKALAAKPEAKTAFASAVAKTTGLDASAITITAIYVDGVKAARRLANSTESTVTFDWEAKGTAAVSTGQMDAAKLQTQIVAEVKAVADVTIVITAAPTVSIVAQPSGSDSSAENQQKKETSTKFLADPPKKESTASVPSAPSRGVSSSLSSICWTIFLVCCSLF
jgi:hypothetical protein